MSESRHTIPSSGGLAVARALVLVALVASQQGDGLYPLCGDRGREAGAGSLDIPPPEWSRRRMGRCKGARAPGLDGVQLRRAQAVVCLSGSRMRPEGSCPLWTWTLLSVPSLLRSGLREPAGERDAPCASPGADDTGAPWREREHDEVLPGEAQGDAP